MLQKETCHKDIMSFSGLLYPTLFMLYKTLQTILEAWNTLHHFLFLDKGWLLQDKQKNVLGYFFVEKEEEEEQPYFFVPLYFLLVQ